MSILSSASLEAPKKLPLGQVQPKARVLDDQSSLMEIPSVSAALSKKPESAMDIVPSTPASLPASKPVEKPKTEELSGWEKYKALHVENTRVEPRPFIVPERRFCKIGMQASWEARLYADIVTFVKPEEIVEVHPMRILRNSPFVRHLEPEDLTSSFPPDHPIWAGCCKDFAKESEAIAITKDGKHVILQQTCQSCVPTCVAMLALDNGKKANYDAIENTYGADSDRAMEWMKEAGLKPKLTKIHDKKNARDQLIQCLSEHGPGILDISASIGGHVIIIDEICTKTNTAKIRDTFHGWALTIKLDALLSWIENSISPPDFIQILPS